MSAAYTLRVTTEFAAAHVLRGYDGPCSRVHGHNWRVEVHVRAHELDAGGMAIDFRELSSLTEGVTEQLDHRLLNDVAPFTEVNPTAENVAAFIYQEVGSKLAARAAGPDIQLLSVTIHENDRISVQYTSHD